MKKFTINCDFGGQLSPFTIFIGRPEHTHNPLHFQNDWLSKQRGGTIPGDVMDAVSQLQELAEKNGVPLEELCVYALGTKEEQAELEGAIEEHNAEDNQVTPENTDEVLPVSEDDNVEESEPK